MIRRKSLLKILTLLALSTLLEAKETPIESHISMQPTFEEITKVEIAVMEPVDMLMPVSFDSRCLDDYSTVIQMLWI